MTSEERHEARYKRRKAKRLRKVAERSKQYTQDVFTPEAIANAYKLHKKNTGKKTSVQRYGSNLTANVVKASKEVLSGRWKSKGFYEFDIIERGKARHIMTTDVEEKCIQRAFCDNCLVPILQSYLIYDNSATIKGKGTDFALDHLTEALRHHYRKYKREGGIYFFDFTNFFGNIDNVLLTQEVGKKLLDDLCRKMYEAFVFAFGSTGLGLGSQVSQISAVFFPNAVDHLIKNHLGVKGYGRYMDDGYIICNDIATLKKIVKLFEDKCEELHIKMNRKKCHIYKLTKPFKFLKVRFRLLESGAVIRKINRISTRKERQRLKKYKNFVLNSIMTIRDVRLQLHSWICQQNRGMCHDSIVSMIKWYNEVFKGMDVFSQPKKKKYRRLIKLSRYVRRMVA